MSFRLGGLVVATLIACLTWISPASAAQWAKMYGGPAQDSAGGVWPAGDGNYNLTGSTTSFGAGGIDGLFAKLDPLGRITWAKTVGGIHDDVLIIDEVSDGFFVTGTTKSFSPDGNWNIVWAKFTASWAPVYQKILTGSGTMNAGVFTPTADGGLIFSGSTNAYSANPADMDLLVMKTTATGAIAWSKVFHYGPFDTAAGLPVVTSDGGYLVPASVQDPVTGFSQILLVKLSSTGVVTWAKRYATMAGMPMATTLHKTADGGYLLFGTMTTLTGRQSIMVIKINSSGVLEWQKTYGKTTLNAMAIQLILNDDGTLIVTGATSTTSFENNRMLIMKLDALGTLLWQKSFGDAVNNIGSVLMPAPGGGWLWSGLRYTTSASTADVLYGRLDTNFEPVWTRKFGSTLDDGGLLLDDPPGLMIGGFTESFGAGDGTPNMFAMTLDPNGDFPGCYVTPLTLAKIDPGLTASAVAFTATATTPVQRSAGAAQSVTLSVLPAGLVETNLCAGGTPPSAPSALNVTALSSSSLELSWKDNASDETGFRVERKTGACAAAGTWAQIATKTANTVMHVDSGRAANTVYSYRVRAYNASGNSAYSACASAATGIAGTPAAPTALKATSASASSVSLGWTDNATTETSFKIYRKTGTGAFTLIKTTAANVRAWSDAAATGNTTTTEYAYYVMACNAAGCSRASVAAIVPFAPTTVRATAGATAGRINVTWEDTDTNEGGFQVQRKAGACSAAGTWALAKTTAASVRSFADTGRTSGAVYSYRVRSFTQSAAQPSAWAYSSWSNCAQATAP